MEDIFAGDVSQQLVPLVMATALSSPPFLFPEAWRSSSHMRDYAVTHKWEGNVGCRIVRRAGQYHSGSSGCGNDASRSQAPGRWPGTEGPLLSVAVLALCPWHMGGEVWWNWDGVALELVSASWCCALAVLISCALKPVLLHDLCPLGRCHRLPLVAYQYIIPGGLSQVTRVRHGALSSRRTLCKELLSVSQPHFPASRSTCIVQGETEIKLASLWCGHPGLEPCRETERKTTWQWGWASLVSKCYRKRKSDTLAVTWRLSQVFACGSKIYLLRPKRHWFLRWPHKFSGFSWGNDHPSE